MYTYLSYIVQFMLKKCDRSSQCTCAKFYQIHSPCGLLHREYVYLFVTLQSEQKYILICSYIDIKSYPMFFSFV